MTDNAAKLEICVTHDPIIHEEWNDSACATEERWSDCRVCGEYLGHLCLWCDEPPTGPFFCDAHRREHEESMAKALERYRASRG